MSPEERWEWEREGSPRDIFGLPDTPSYDWVITAFFAARAVSSLLTVYGAISLIQDIGGAI